MESKTPIQKLSAILKENRNDKKLIQIDYVIELLEYMLPQEKRFAQTCFSAGKDYEQHQTDVTFTNFYKQFEK